MKVLLDGGADPFLTLPDRTNTLMIAAGLGYGGLRGEGIRIVVPTPEGAVEAVTAAARSRHGRRRVQQRRQTALHGAVGRGDAVVKLLASRGATLTSRTRPASRRSTSRGAGGRGGRGGVVREEHRGAAAQAGLIQQAEGPRTSKSAQ